MALVVELLRVGGLQRDEDCKEVVVLLRSTRGKGAEECCRCGEPLWWCKSVGVLQRHKRLVEEPVEATWVEDEGIASRG